MKFYSWPGKRADTKGVWISEGIVGRHHHGTGDPLNRRKAGPGCHRSPCCWSSCVKGVVPPSLTCSGKPEHPSKNSSLQLPESPPFPIQHSGRSRAPLLQLPVLLLASFLHLPSWKRQAISGFYPNSDLLQCSYHLEFCWDSDLLENSCLSLKTQFQWMARSLFASALHQPGTPGSGCLFCGP